MKNMAEQNNKTSIPFILQSFGPEYENPPSNSSSRLKSHHKKIQHTFHQTYYQEETPGLTCQTSRKRLEVEDRAINEHYQNMQKILLNENLNLKQQNSYLTSEVRKALRRQEKLKEELRNLNSRLRSCAEEINHIEADYINAKDLVQKQMSYLSIGLKSNNVFQIKNMVWRYIDEVSNHFRIEIDQNFPSKEIVCQDRRENEENLSEIDNEIQILTKKLEKLLEEKHDQKKGMAVRKQCIQISKQLKQLKEKSRTMSIQSLPQNQMSDIVTGSRPRPSLPTKKSRSKEHAPRNQMFRSESIKEEPEERSQYQTQIYSKVTRRKSMNRESKMSKESSRGKTSMMSPSGSDHRLE